MTAETIPDDYRAPLSELIAGALGLHFPEERWPDLERGLKGAAAELGFASARECADWLLSALPSRTQVQVLAAHLTVGETYFFRDQGVFDLLATHVLPPLLEARRSEGRRRLRVWSAGCCTGEEPYSLAILLRQLLPDLADWHVTILATDINPGFLRKAVAGLYGDWSFRGTPAGFREKWFRRAEGGRRALTPEVRGMVTFTQLNLAEDNYPSLATDTNAMDVIFCRNVLMYFTPERAARVIGGLHRALADDGWLVVSPSEAAPELFTQFARRSFAGVALYQKSASPEPEAPLASSITDAPAWFVPEPAPVWTPLVPEPPPQPAGAAGVTATAPPAPYEQATAAYAEGRYAAAVDLLLAAAAKPVSDPRAFSLLARASANQGKLGEALGWCERWLAADKLEPAAHYLQAMILLEQGEETQARLALQRAVYLDPAYVPAHFALGSLARVRGRADEAQRHFSNTLRLLAHVQPGEVLPESDGLTAGRLVETIKALSPMEALA